MSRSMMEREAALGMPDSNAGSTSAFMRHILSFPSVGSLSDE
jgi:hypothetical protein